MVNRTCGREEKERRGGQVGLGVARTGLAQMKINWFKAFEARSLTRLCQVIRREDLARYFARATLAQ